MFICYDRYNAWLCFQMGGEQGKTERVCNSSAHSAKSEARPWAIPRDTIGCGGRKTALDWLIKLSVKCGPASVILKFSV